MNQIYISTIPLQAPEKLIKSTYTPENFILKENFETSFPIIPVMKNTHMDIYSCKQIVIIQNIESALHNFETYKNELKEHGLPTGNIYPVYIEPDQNNNTINSLLMKLIDLCEPNSEYYTCMTYGTKTIPIITLTLLNYISKIIPDTEIDGIYYGEINWANNTKHLYNTAYLMNIGNIIDSCAARSPEKAAALVKMLLSE